MPGKVSPSPLTVSFYTLGCKLNQVETEAAALAFQRAGFSVVEYPEPADITILNTCTVTSKSEQKARRVIRKILREQPRGAVLATGCYVQMEPEAVVQLGDRVVTLSQDLKDRLLDLPARLAAAFPGADFLPPEGPSAGFRGTGFSQGTGREGLLPFLRSWAREAAAAEAPLDGGSKMEPPQFRYNITDYPFHTRAFLKIQDGCANRCAYCRVTLARGEPVSMDANRVVEQMRALAAAGYSEVVLTGINLACYRGESPGGKLSLDGLLRRIIREAPGPRIRLSSLEPEMITPELIGVLAEPRICPHYHISVQSGSDAVLGAMRRRYRRERVYQAVRALKQTRQVPLLAADVIAGFPGESEADFQQTLDLLTELEFGALHVFPFSPRPGTEAAGMGSQVPSGEIKARAARLRRLDRGLRQRYAAGLEGRPGQAVTERVFGPDEEYSSGGGVGVTAEYQEVFLDGRDWGRPGPGGLRPGAVCEGFLSGSGGGGGGARGISGRMVLKKG